MNLGEMSGITYRKDFGYWWPDYDHKPEVCYGLVTRNKADIQFGIKLCKQRDRVIQAGGHAGLWAIELAKTFKNVHTFEPEPALFECMRRNIDGTAIHAWKLALGDTVGDVMLRPHVSAGSWSVQEDGTVPVKQVTIDSLGFTTLNLLILDIEGYEPQALRGAAQTIAKCRPVIHVEMLNRPTTEVTRTVLNEFGYMMVRKIHKDEIYVPR